MFGFLKKKPVKEPEVDIFLEGQKKMEIEIFEKYPIGRELEYMRVTIRITNHTYYAKGFYSPYSILPTVYPCIECNYVDSNGQIRNASFSLNEVKTWDT